MKHSQSHEQQSGATLVLVIIAIVVVAALAAGMASLTGTTIIGSTRTEELDRAYYLATSGINYARYVGSQGDSTQLAALSGQTLAVPGSGGQFTIISVGAPDVNNRYPITARGTSSPGTGSEANFDLLAWVQLSEQNSGPVWRGLMGSDAGKDTVQEMIENLNTDNPASASAEGNVSTKRIGSSNALALDFRATLLLWGSRIQVNNQPILSPTTEGTVMCWFNMDTYLAYGGLIHKGNDVFSNTYDNPSDLSYSLQFWRYSLFGGGHSGELVFALFGSSSKILVYSGVNFWPSLFRQLDDTWFHVAATWDSEWVKMYINGCEVGSVYNMGAMAARTSVGDLHIGVQKPLFLGITAYPFQGSIFDAAIFDRALSADEVECYYAYSYDKVFKCADDPAAAPTCPPTGDLNCVNILGSNWISQDIDTIVTSPCP